MNKEVFGKPIENVRKIRDSKLVTRKRINYYLVSEPNYHSTRFFTKYLLAIEMKKKKKKKQKLMNKFLYLELSSLELKKC